MGFRNSPNLSGRRDTTESLTNLEFKVPCFKSQQCPFLPVVSFGNGDLHFPYDDAPYSLLERSYLSCSYIECDGCTNGSTGQGGIRKGL